MYIYIYLPSQVANSMLQCQRCVCIFIYFYMYIYIYIYVHLYIFTFERNRPFLTWFSARITRCSE